LEDVYNAVLNGKVEDAAAGVAKGLNDGIAVNEILKKGLLAAMDLVGDRILPKANRKKGPGLSSARPRVIFMISGSSWLP